MIKRFYAAIILVAFAATMSGCAERAEQYIELNGSKTAGLWVGQVLRVEMAANPTTGYLWETSGELNGVVRQKGKYRYVRKSDAIGSGGKQAYRYVALKKGKVAITFEYKRPWEKEEKPAKKYVLKIIVH